MQNRSRDEQRTVGGLLVASLKGLFTAILVSFGLLLGFAAISLGLEDPIKPLWIFALASLLCGAAAGGYAAGAFGNDPLSGVICGAEYVMLIWLGALLLRGRVEAPLSPLLSAIGYAVCILTALICGLAAVNRIPSGKRRSPTAARRKMARQRK